MVSRILAATLWIACATGIVRAEESAILTPKAAYDITEPQDIDSLIEKNYAKRKPPMNTQIIADAWKAILADCYSDTPYATRIEPASRPIKIIYDSDIGTDIDDAIALTFALQRPDIDVLAIVTSRGEVEKRAAIVSRLLKVLGKDEIPFAAGSPVLFDGSRIEKDKPVGQFPFAGPAEDRPKAATEDAQELLVNVINANPGEVWLVVVGPMTNAAMLIRDHPETAAKLKGIAIMGGEPARRAKETNIVNDKTAAAYVFASGLIRFVATDDICKRVIYPKPDMDRLRQAETPVARSVVQLVDLWRLSQFVKPGPLCPDSLPLAWLVAPDIFTTEEQGLVVQGSLVVQSDQAPRCLVTTDIDAVSMHRLVMGTLLAP